MKIIQLPDDDFQVLKVAHAACQEAAKALDKAHKANKSAQADYIRLCQQISAKHKLDNARASDDQRFIYGQPLGSSTAGIQPPQLIDYL